jgi:hypothetical protein
MENTKTLTLICFLLISSVATYPLPVKAEHNLRREERQEHERFRKQRDIRHFDHRDYAVWRSGSWHHTRRDGKLGWWWVVAGTWYFYPRPVYPYPDPYIPPAVVVQPAPPVAPPPAQYWYYCPSANNYYPYIASCPEGWQSVPATPSK